VTGLDAEQAAVAALAGLPEMTPVRLAAMLDRMAPTEAWDAVRAGTHPADRRHRFRATARATEIGAVREAYARASVSVLLPDRPGYPTALAGDPGAPAVLFAVGDPGVIEDRPRVAIVGTRSPTPYGQRVASEMAEALAEAGVAVVSGLAVGIDAAAHAGASRCRSPAAPSAAVTGTDLGPGHPSLIEQLRSTVALRGVAFSEVALGSRPPPWLFPAHHRIIAALSDVVVVVESRHAGSTHTVEAATRRSIPVCAVPGSVHSRASDGTNQLLFDGCSPARDATDVLAAVYLARATAGRPLEPLVGRRG
jgi:DNA processing protein